MVIGSGAYAILLITWVFVLVELLAVLAFGLPDVLRLLADLVQGRDLLGESELDRQLEGGLLAPGYSPKAAQGLCFRGPIVQVLVQTEHGLGMPQRLRPFSPVDQPRYNPLQAIRSKGRNFSCHGYI